MTEEKSRGGVRQEGGFGVGVQNALTGYNA